MKFIVVTCPLVVLISICQTLYITSDVCDLQLLLNGDISHYFEKCGIESGWLIESLLLMILGVSVLIQAIKKIRLLIAIVIIPLNIFKIYYLYTLLELDSLLFPLLTFGSLAIIFLVISSLFSKSSSSNAKTVTPNTRAPIASHSSSSNTKTVTPKTPADVVSHSSSSISHSTEKNLHDQQTTNSSLAKEETDTQKPIINDESKISTRKQLPQLTPEEAQQRKTLPPPDLNAFVSKAAIPENVPRRTTKHRRTHKATRSAVVETTTEIKTNKPKMQASPMANLADIMAARNNLKTHKHK
ncbi:hypothetical protein QTN25_001707 [Entamoeba marina]